MCGVELCGKSKNAAGTLTATITENAGLNKSKVKTLDILEPDRSEIEEGTFDALYG